MGVEPATRDLPLDEVVDEIVRRIVERFAPEKVILFGSHARGEAGRDSDVDLLVVMPFAGSKRKKTVEVRLAVRGMGVAKDVFLVTPEELEFYRDAIGTIVRSALREGKVLYERPA